MSPLPFLFQTLLGLKFVFLCEQLSSYITRSTNSLGSGSTLDVLGENSPLPPPLQSLKQNITKQKKTKLERLAFILKPVVWSACLSRNARYVDEWPSRSL